MREELKSERIPIAGPWIGGREVEYVSEAAAHAWYERASMFNDRFERAFAGYVGRRFAVAVPHCTSALHLALAALGVGPGDEVIVPDATWIATAAPVSYVGATPVFADVDPRSWCISAGAIARCVTKRTKAVIAVDLYGSMPDMDAIRALTDRHGLVLVEDAAEAIGSRYRDRRAGSFGVAGTFSFHGSKTMTTGEGGMLVTDDQAIHDRVLFLRDHGRPPGDKTFVNKEIAFKYRMSGVQAALGLAQLERIDELVGRKRRIFEWYRDRLGGIEALQLNAEPAGTFNSYWMVTMILDDGLGLEARDVIAALDARGIDSRPFFYPLSSLPAYRDRPEARDARQRNPHSYRLSKLGLNLPSALRLTAEDVRRVCDAVRDLVGAPRCP